MDTCEQSNEARRTRLNTAWALAAALVLTIALIGCGKGLSGSTYKEIYGSNTIAFVNDDTCEMSLDFLGNQQQFALSYKLDEDTNTIHFNMQQAKDAASNAMTVGGSGFDKYSFYVWSCNAPETAVLSESGKSLKYEDKTFLRE